jgi:hypothetical protein
LQALCAPFVVRAKSSIIAGDASGNASGHPSRLRRGNNGGPPVPRGRAAGPRAKRNFAGGFPRSVISCARVRAASRSDLRHNSRARAVPGAGELRVRAATIAVSAAFACSFAASPRRVALHYGDIRLRFQTNPAVRRGKTRASLRRAVRHLRNHRRHEQNECCPAFQRGAAAESEGRRHRHHATKPQTDGSRARLAPALRGRAGQQRNKLNAAMVPDVRHLDLRPVRPDAVVLIFSAVQFVNASGNTAARIAARVRAASRRIARTPPPHHRISIFNFPFSNFAFRISSLRPCPAASPSCQRAPRLQPGIVACAAPDPATVSARIIATHSTAP